MPQMRAVMSGTSPQARPRRNASKKRGGSKIRSSRRAHLAVPHRHLERALALDAREVVDLDRPSRHGGRPRRGTSGASGVEGAIEALEVALAACRAASSQRAERRRVRRLHRPVAAVAAAVEGRAERAAAGVRHRPEAGRAVRHHHADVAPELALDADAVGRRRSAGGRLRNALITSSSWCLLIGQPRSSKSTGTGPRSGSRLPASRCTRAVA